MFRGCCGQMASQIHCPCSPSLDLGYSSRVPCPPNPRLPAIILLLLSALPNAPFPPLSLTYIA
ncbi:no significant blast hit [Histoplasma capsulatum var. duboisii H88]|uniref:No significant blast hit n=1 Tax=Ajellomyces capsulatus (strain H88) TaxID=544711 RepID=A0A8A1LLN8_AJEC8|nr:no significant blast hit [Histoplasma capsulatum var. duboisii H88]